jgi:phosphonopyruvate decarboxylase
MTGDGMTVREAVQAINRSRGNALAVVTMSALAHWEARDDDFRLLGLMGGAASIGLGIALGCPSRSVLVVDGDGSLLMQLGVMSAVADARPQNFIHVVIANGQYAISGGQPVPGSPNWPGLFAAAGYETALTCSTPPELEDAFSADLAKPSAVVAICDGPDDPPHPSSFSFSVRDEVERVRGALSESQISMSREQ